MDRSSPLVILLVAGCIIAAGMLPYSHAADKAPEPVCECRWTSTPITLDGKANEAAWDKAQVIDRFTTPWLDNDPAAKTATRARLLWDADAMYFFAEMEDGDLFADITEHDGETC